jgi:hypothetical protein
MVAVVETAVDSGGRRRRLVVVLLLFGSPVFAELLAAYLADSGDLLAGLGLIVFLAPLYGGASLLVREVAVRTGRGWRGRLLLATAFGVAMPTLVDVSLFTPHNPDVENWDMIMGAAVIGGSSISVYAVVTWVAGHVVMSICAPLAVAEGLVPGERQRSWVAAKPLVTLAVLGVGIAMLIRVDEATVRPSTGQTTISAVIVLALVAAAFGPWGRPLPPRMDTAVPGPVAVGVVGFTVMLAFDIAPISWVGVGVEVLALIAAWLYVRRRARSTHWGWRQIATLGYGAILARASIAFLVPVPSDVDPAAKYAQNVLLLALVAGLGLVLHRSLTATDATGTPHDPPQAERGEA